MNPVHQLPVEILFEIAKAIITVSTSYTEGYRTQLLHPYFRQSRDLRRRLYERWARLDVEKGFPHFRIQAAIAGSIDVFATTKNIWDGLLEHSVPVGRFAYDQPDATPLDRDVERLGEEAAYNVAVMRSVMRRGGDGRDINVQQPLFASEADKNTYVNCLSEFASAEKGVKGLYFIEILSMLSRSSPIGEADSTPVTTPPSPAFAILDMYLKHLSSPSVNRISELQSRLWTLLCSASISSLPLLQHISGYYFEVADRQARNEVVQQCVNSLMASYDDKLFDASSFTIKAIDWLCSEQHLRVHCTATITARALNGSRKNLFNYMLQNHSNVDEGEFLATLVQ